jgi:hypothetical protein
MIKPWPIVESTKGPDMSLFSIRINRCRSPRTGQEHNFYIIDFPSWVQIIDRISCGRSFSFNKHLPTTRSPEPYRADLSNKGSKKGDRS